LIDRPLALIFMRRPDQLLVLRQGEELF